MKKQLLLVLLALTIQFTYSQQKDPRNAQFDFVPGKIIVKLKDDVQAKVQYNAKGVGTTQTDIGKLLGIGDKVSKSKVLFSERSVQQSVARKSAKKKDPRVPNPHTLKNTFVLELKNKEENILGLIEELNKNSKVEYAEPNYNYNVNDFTIDSEIIYPDKTVNTTNVSNTPDDPLYSQQANISSVKIDSVWSKYTTGDGSQIIAILDTGIDYNHPDLATNIWINEAELNGVEGFDDDGNGYIDDIRGWDFINIDNEPLDDNMHGTHVAGIAGAVGNNGIGIAGAAWNVKLMPIKVFQASGFGDVLTISKGVEYAVENKATIINMSFSGSDSNTLRNILENAYSSSFLVAATGNNKLDIGPCPGCSPRFPAAYTFVLGVESNGGYSNYDRDGPIFSGYGQQYNYETKAPGNSILSTVPNGGYRELTGTSMAGPLMSGAIALYKQINPDDNKELTFGNIINTKGDIYADINLALEITPKPILKITSIQLIDSVSTNSYIDGEIDSGEQIHFYPVVKNYWSTADSVKVEFRLGGNEFQNEFYKTKVSLIDSIVDRGVISDYAIDNRKINPIKFLISNDVMHNTEIEYQMIVWDANYPESKDTTNLKFQIKNMIKLEGIINNSITLSSDKKYYIKDDLLITNGSTLTINPGTTIIFGYNYQTSKRGGIRFWDSSKLIANGTKDSLITFTSELGKGGLHLGGSVESFSDYCVFDYSSVQGYVNISNAQFINGGNVGGGSYTMSIKDSNLFFPGGSSTNPLSEALVKESINLQGNGFMRYNNSFVKLNQVNSGYFTGDGWLPLALYASPGGITYDLNYVYLGTSTDENLKIMTHDFFDHGNYGLFDFTSTPRVPYSEPHGIVWKVLVNGKDAYDEYDLIDPVGIGMHTFEVYFNRVMDTNYPPQISYGVRIPYTQKVISEEGSWSADRKIYTVAHEVKIGSADGVNRIRVQGAKDLDHFEIPIDDKRFNIFIQSAGSASAGFAATPGLGEITLDWELPATEELEDVLGYNMYRYKAITDSTFTDTAKINTALINTLQFEDFDVEEGKKYFYQYKILRTNFEETDFSKTVTTQPLTSKLGDSNGDFDVNVMDLVQEVDYILGNNPTPFIFKAADVNNDTFINVLDIVGTVDIILNPTSGKTATKGSSSINYYNNNAIGDATFYWVSNDLYVESLEPITGIQLAFEKDFSYTTSQTLSNFEWLNYEQENQKITMLYSFSNIQIPAGKTKLLTKSLESETNFNIDKAVVATTKGLKLNALFENKGVLDIDAPEQGAISKIFTLGPNPTNGLLNMFYYLPEKMDKVSMSAYDLQGKIVWTKDTFKNTSGQNTASVDISSLKNGVYFIVIDVVRDNQVQAREVNRIIVNK